MKRLHDLYWWKANAFNVSCIILIFMKKLWLVPNFSDNKKDRLNLFHKFLSHTNYLQVCDSILLSLSNTGVLWLMKWLKSLHFFESGQNNDFWLMLNGLLASCVHCILFVASCVGIFLHVPYFHGQQPFAPQCLKIVCLKYY